MPELPEVQTVISGILPHVRGRRIRSLELRRRDIVEPGHVNLTTLLHRRTIRGISRHGKKIIFELDNAHRFVIHLGMSGHLSIHDAGEEIEKHTHLIFSFADCQLRFVDPRRFGGVFWLGSDGDPCAGMGPDAIAISAEQLADSLRGSRRPIKSALLDQTVLAGVGNIYADEALFAAAIHPQKFCSRLNRPAIERLHASVRSILLRAIKQRGSSVRSYTDSCGKPGSFQDEHQVYDRAGDPCVNCGSAIKRIVVAGRGTHFCPTCQKR